MSEHDRNVSEGRLHQETNACSRQSSPLVRWPNDASGPSGRASTPILSFGRDGQTWPVRAERGGYFEFCRRLAPGWTAGEVTVRPEEVIEPVRIMGVLYAGHHQWDRYGGRASGPGADHWRGT
jgi:hypothetical protein